MYGVLNRASYLFIVTIRHAKGLAKYKTRTLNHEPHVRLQRFRWAAGTVVSHYVFGSFLPSSSEVRSEPRPLTVHHSLPGEPEDSSEWRCLRRPEFIGASACQHDRLLVSYAKGEGRGGLLGPRALQQQASLQASWGRQPGPPRAPAEREL